MNTMWQLELMMFALTVCWNDGHVWVRCPRDPHASSTLALSLVVFSVCGTSNLELLAQLHVLFSPSCPGA